MTQPKRRTETVIWIDANGNPTDNKDEAVRGEIEVINPDGTHENVLFERDRSAATRS